MKVPDSGHSSTDNLSPVRGPQQSLEQFLLESAARYAFRSLEANLDRGYNDFALFAGIAVEHAAKARLVSENATFIAGSQNFRIWLNLDRASENVCLLLQNATTVGASEALKRCSELDPGIKGTLKAAKQLIDMRNGEAHMGDPGVSPSHHQFVDFVQTMEALLPGQGPKLWREHQDYVKDAIDGRTKETHALVEYKLAQARIQFTSLAGHFERQAAEARRDTKVDGLEVMAAECPACGQAAIALGETQETGIDAEIDEDGLGSVFPVLTFFASALECEACGLTLDNEKQLEVAWGEEASWFNNDVDLDQWMEDNWTDDWLL